MAADAGRHVLSGRRSRAHVTKGAKIGVVTDYLHRPPEPRAGSRHRHLHPRGAVAQEGRHDARAWELNGLKTRLDRGLAPQIRRDLAASQLRVFYVR